MPVDTTVKVELTGVIQFIQMALLLLIIAQGEYIQVSS